MTGNALLLTHKEAIPLAHALTARVASEHGIRLLAIKGVTLSHHGLRDPRTSADIDVILSPEDLDSFVAAMEAAGWRIAAPHENATLLGHHSVDLLNDHWPIGIDLHTFFPGFLAPADEVFDALWQRREQIDVAGHHAQITDLTSSAAVAALHHLRAPWRAENKEALERLIAKSRARLSAADLETLGGLAQITASVQTLAPYFQELGLAPVPVHPAEESEFAHWEHGTQAHPYTAWWHQLKQLPLRQRPRALWRLIALPEDEMRAYHGSHDPDAQLWRLHVQRITRIVGAVPGTIRHELGRRAKR